MKILSAQNLYDMKQECFGFTGKFQEVFGNPPTNGIWAVQGAEKHGKTSFMLSLVKYLSDFAKVLYVSAEEGTDPLFVNSVQRANIPSTNQIGFLPYISIEELNYKLKKRNAPRIVVIDNMTVYRDELRRNRIIEFMREHKDILLIFISHEEKNKQPSTASGKLVRKLAKIIIRIEGAQAQIMGRCPGGIIEIYEPSAQKYGIKL